MLVRGRSSGGQQEVTFLGDDPFRQEVTDTYLTVLALVRYVLYASPCSICILSQV